VFAVDTNVLVYAANEDSPAHARCREALEAWRRDEGAWFTSWGVLYEFLRVTTHPRVLARPWTADAAWGFVRSLLSAPGFQILVPAGRHAEVAEACLGDVPRLAGNVFHDVHLAVLMREHGVRRVYTADADFLRFPWVEVVDPTRSSPRAGEAPAAYRRRRAPSARAPRATR
jgi:toxin-antitoxin system PIN domain toxin